MGAPIVGVAPIFAISFAGFNVGKSLQQTEKNQALRWGRDDIKYYCDYSVGLSLLYLHANVRISMLKFDLSFCLPCHWVIRHFELCFVLVCLSYLPLVWLLGCSAQLWWLPEKESNAFYKYRQQGQRSSTKVPSIVLSSFTGRVASEAFTEELWRPSSEVNTKDLWEVHSRKLVWIVEYVKIRELLRSQSGKY